MRVSLFITCLNDVFFPGVGKATVEVLERLGCEIDFPTEQTCCGQPAYNSGYQNETKEIAKHMIRTFEHAEYVVAPSGSCAMMFHEYEKLFADDHIWKEKARVLADKTYEFSQFLVDVLKVEDVGSSLKANATYHRSCHMIRLLGVKDAPMKLLHHVRGLHVTELPHAYDCCGFGGTFSVKMVPISEQIVDEKIRHIEETGADLLIGADCGCLMNIGGRLQRKRKPIKVMHIAEVLNQR
ncbi:lactate utilization protein A [Collibacillus ludicampi]|uniref:Lactate utilization protein A n=1 Tax=Collibacillus ludicampi TaxID=2771369 RepID=A0AAV4LKN7_9BACL|nr:(Fe-S)-binding protein [Collibacillus ludicampi]GIM48383.1 lactate utilization protein A [Collibacillus ludicampi]